MNRRHPASLSLLALCLWLMLAGSLFPQGYMPVGRAGSVTIALCSQFSSKTITIDLDQDRPTQHSGSSNCDGTVPMTAVLPPAPAIIAPSLFIAAAPAPAPAEAKVPFGAFNNPNAPPQAPPLLSA